ncbi:hypothetical protein like AT1G70180 [Hibiscus trionum]|uniref:SAM domain-containing protein n=1 Tax=Hibiscus trionum TaxID=183268 RepID=A0A9W7LW12_HIBTR|nr:hypothetical protein like AT1G70180 [Hibiscus trionum]
MAEASRGRVTITLGRSGQVVKRSGAAPDVDLSDSHPVAGTKRSVRDRLGGNADSSFLSQPNNKRQRGDGHTTILNANGLNDVHISKDDLRFKIMQKNVFRRAQNDNNQKGMDLREKLSRIGQPRPNSYERHRVPESRETSILGKVPSARSVDDFPRVTTSSSYSPWTLDHLRQRSPESVMGASRGLSPSRNVEVQRRPVNRTYMGKDVLDAPRPVSTTSFVAKSTLPTTSAKPTPPGPSIPSTIPPRNIVQKSPYLVDEQRTVEGLLHSLGLGKYAIYFKAEEVDMTALKQMGENDLKELGIPMGPRKKILLALLPRSRRQQPQP